MNKTDAINLPAGHGFSVDRAGTGETDFASLTASLQLLFSMSHANEHTAQVGSFAFGVLSQDRVRAT